MITVSDSARGDERFERRENERGWEEIFISHVNVSTKIKFRYKYPANAKNITNENIIDR